MKASQKIGILIESGTVAQATCLVSDLMEYGRTELATDLYRCITGNEKAKTKALDKEALQDLAERLQIRGF